VAEVRRRVIGSFENAPLILLASITMQTHEELDPTVRIRDLKKDRVNFVLENVDLACGRFATIDRIVFV
jgi:hypothetical protein